MYAHFHDQDVAGQRFSNDHDPNHLKVQTKIGKSFEFIFVNLVIGTDIWLAERWKYYMFHSSQTKSFEFSPFNFI